MHKCFRNLWIDNNTLWFKKQWGNLLKGYELYVPWLYRNIHASLHWWHSHKVLIRKWSLMPSSTVLWVDEEIWTKNANPLKCVLCVHVGDFLGFVVHKKGIEMNKNKIKVILDLKPPSTKKQLQSLLGKTNFMRISISNLSDKTHVLSLLLRLKKESDFI